MEALPYIEPLEVSTLDFRLPFMFAIAGKAKQSKAATGVIDSTICLQWNRQCESAKISWKFKELYRDS